MIAGLWRAARDEVLGQRGGAQLLADTALAAGEAPEVIRRYAGERRRLAVAGCFEESVVGFALASASDRARSRVQLDAIYVEPAARGVGVGDAMMAAVLAWATQEGCEGVDAPALPGNRAAKAFFEGQGFTARLLVMHRKS